MKKVLLVAVAGMFVLASCKKDRTCECTTLGVTDKSNYEYKKVTKKFMKENKDCVSYVYTEDNKSVTTECKIK
jgi:hypothetical protein